MEITVKKDPVSGNNAEYIQIPLNPSEVKAAKQIVTQFFAGVKKQSVDNHLPTLYYHVLLMAHIQSEKYLEALGMENLSDIMCRFAPVHQEQMKEGLENIKERRSY